MVNHGANVNASAQCGTTPLIDAASNGHQTIVKILLKHGANPLQRNKRGQSAIDLAYDEHIEGLLRNHLENKHQSKTISSSSSSKKSVQPSDDDSDEELLASKLEDQNNLINQQQLKEDENEQNIGKSSVTSTSEQTIRCDRHSSIRTSDKSIMPSQQTTSITNTTSTTTVTTASQTPSTVSSSSPPLHVSSFSSPVSTLSSTTSASVITSAISSGNGTITTATTTTTTGSESSKQISSLVTTTSNNNDSSEQKSTLENDDLKKIASSIGNETKKSSGDGSGSSESGLTSSQIDDGNKSETVDNSKNDTEQQTSLSVVESGNITTSAIVSKQDAHVNENITKDSVNTPASHQLRGRKRRRSGDSVNNSAKKTPKDSSKSSKRSQQDDLIDSGSTPVNKIDSNNSSAAGEDGGQRNKDNDDGKNVDPSFAGSSHTATSNVSSNNSEQMMMRVPPIRIVLPPSNSNSVSNSSSAVVTGGGTNNTVNSGPSGSNPSMIVINPVNSGNGSQTVSCVDQYGNGNTTIGGNNVINGGGNGGQPAQKYPYVVTSTGDQQQTKQMESVDNLNAESLTNQSINTSAVISSTISNLSTTSSSIFASSASSSTTTNTTATTTTTSNHRITRSSQRVAQQKHHHDDDAPVSTGTRKKKNRAQANTDRSSLGHAVGNTATSNTTAVGGSGNSNNPASGGGTNTNSNYYNYSNDRGSGASSGQSNLNQSNQLTGTNSSGQISENADGDGNNNNNENGGGGDGSGGPNGTGNTIGPNGSNGEFNMNLYQYQPERSSHRMFMAIRDHVLRRRRTMPIPTMNESKQPPGFQNYLLNRCDYLLRTTPQPKLPEHLQMTSPPTKLARDSPLYSLFIEQERERHHLRLRHRVEQDKLCMVVQQETLRLYNRADMYKKNQTMPLSVCTYLKDEELYNKLELETDHSQDNVIIAQIKTDNPSFLNDGPSALTGCGRIRFNGRVFLSWKSDDDDKWNKIKIDMLNRQQMEAESLASIQRLRWQWKLAELEPSSGGSGSSTSNLTADINNLPPMPNVSELFVPIVQVVKDFELKPN